jgi:hypothetical protein
MAAIDIICLANSRKHGGRCVAGIRTDGKGWIRLVADSADGALFEQHRLLGRDGEPKPLDVIRVFVDRAKPGPHHPEDWVLMNRPWELLERPAGASLIQSLSTYLIPGPTIFGTYRDRLPMENVAAHPLTTSLELIAPKALRWEIRAKDTGKRQIRAAFNLTGGYYDLPVSDPLWEQQLAAKSVGGYSPIDFGLEKDQPIWLTVSLTEPFQNAYYKLIAAVIVPPQ